MLRPALRPVRRALVLLMAAPLFPIAPAFAADTATAGANAPEETIVSAHRLHLAQPTPIATHVLDAGAIERARVGSLIDLLRRQPGVFATDAFGDGTQTTLSLRGFGGNASANALVVVDGRELNQADLSTPDLDSLTLTDIARLEILSGSSAVRWGDQSTGGVVYLSTYRAGEGTSGIRVATGSDARRELDAVYDAAFGATGVRISAKRHMTDGARRGAEADKTDLLARVGHDTGVGLLDLEFQQVDQDRVALGALTRSQRRADRRQPGSVLATDARTRNARIGWQQAIGEHRFEFDAFRTTFESDSPSSSPTFGDSLTTIEREQLAFDPRVSLRLGGVALGIGADIDRHEVDFANASDLFGTSGSTQEIDANGLWLTASVPVHDDVDVEAGVRRTWVDTRARGFAGTDTISADIDERVTAWDLGVHWQAGDAWQLGARVASGFRLPKADEQVSVFTGFNALQTQTSRSLELNGTWRGEAIVARASLYRIDLAHEIDFDPRAGFFGENLNLGDTRRTGASASVDWALGDTLHASADIEFLRARIEDGGASVPFVPKRRANLALDWAATPWLAVRVEGQYIGPYHAIGDFLNDAPEQGGYTTVDAAVSANWGDVDVTLRADNLLDRDYDALVSYVTFLGPDDRLTYQPDGGRRLLLTLTWRP